MIVIGYQGIGKSTLANHMSGCIDLESSMWRIDGIRNDTWYKEYCNVAEGLSRQGYIVFVSSHKEVRETLKNSKEIVCVCCPSLDLQYEWINKLRLRLAESHLDKDLRALKNAEDRYHDNILELINSGFDVIEIKNMDYSLMNLIYNYLSFKEDHINVS